NRGSIIHDGPVAESVSQYLASTCPRGSSTIELDGAPRKGAGQARFTALRLLDAEGIPCNRVPVGSTLSVEFTFECYQTLRSPSFAVAFTRRDGQRALRVQSSEMTDSLPLCQNGGSVLCQIQEVQLTPGQYFLTIGLANAGLESVDYVENCAS